MKRITTQEAGLHTRSRGLSTRKQERGGHYILCTVRYR